MAGRKNTARWAKNKHRRHLRRRKATYIPNEEYALLQTGDIENNRKILIAPTDFRLTQNTNQTIKYFNQVLENIEKGIYSRIDMSSIERVDLATISVLISIMMDSRSRHMRVRKFMKVTYPSGDNQPGRLFSQSHFMETVTTGAADNTYFLSRTSTIVNSQYNEDVIARTQSFTGGSKYDRTLPPILVEITSNTNNHATPQDAPENFQIPWFMAISEDVEDEKMYFCVVDLGVGIYESLHDKGIAHKDSVKFDDAIRDMYENSQNKFLAQNIPVGVDSSTGLFYRGQGLKRIHDLVQASDYNKFVIITNRAKVDMKRIDSYKADALESFSGTVYYWEISK